MMKWVSKFAMDIFPSVLATVIGAYIVNHYIHPQTPGTTAAAVAPAEPKKAAHVDSKPAERSADLGNVHEPGVRAKGIPEKAISDKSGAEKATEKAAEKEKATDKADKPSETASIPPTTPAENRRHQPAPREKATARAAPAPAAEPVAAAPAAEPDANDLARAAIERLRNNDHSQEAARAPEPARAATAPVMAAPAPPPPVVAAAPSAQPSSGQAPSVQPPSIQPLPPPILVSTPPADSKSTAPDPNRPTPPADIPDPRPPLDLRADAVDAPPAKRTSVADDVLAATKNLFHSVLPKQ